ncbi:tetratricopeptide repeat protein [Opitutus terrae]|uniref:Tetratricopeptide TPR_2 repeat protein n=1 Tax=Opitutus terrae (strain DSM 11246 / JCM 15787 / PB90-1) TaxID=452637 RepID=B1ZSF9_OPITP|nr:tetratricopeptide repeat protein [Opitutus terrae]ACB73816.1 Tetratricopeptide TPR_2 repeat protein [Opitutus terrae PB90-1]
MTALSFRRQLLFAAILIVGGLVLLLGSLELTLRLAHYGYSPHFAERALLPSGDSIWRDNRWCTAPYFSPELVRRPFPFRLPLTKAPGTYRIFVLGSSAAMGDPEPSFSLARMLEAMLRTAYPNQRFEVVNAGVTAINSHLARTIAADCAELSPDLFIVYEGHNEVIGPFGPSGVFAPFLSSELGVRAAIWLKGTRTGQLVSALGRRLTGKSALPADWGGMQMFLAQQIANDDPRLDAVRAHFRANLISIAESAHAAGARTLLCTVLTNQRDFAPFLSRHRSGLTAADLARWDAHVAAAREAERTHRTADAEAEYRAALAIDDEHAELVFRYGRFLLLAGRRQEAQPLLQRALNLDTLRFRTDGSLNKVIRDLRGAHVPGVEVLDLAAALALHSEGGATGDDLLYEHVHLTLRGTYEVAREIFTHVSADLARRQLISGTIAEPFDYDEARLRLGYTMHEQAMIAHELLNRFRAPPFTSQADHALRLKTWEQRTEQASALLARPEALPALRELYERAMTLAPDDWVLARNAGSMLVARQAPADAVPLLQRAADWIGHDVDTLVALGWAQRALGHTAESEAAFNQARALEPRYPNLPKPDAAGDQR